ncbi:MAG: Long-chain-fatty-acid--CoA ligase [Anaerolineae bacterium]|nr:Long-chain-fatty-acid--CoA ligase [Anaerolineae bacterium]
MINTADYLLAAGRNTDTALLTEHTSATYGELKAASARLAQALLAAGVGPTDRVGLLGGNSLFWVAAYLASLKLNAVVVPFSTTLTPAELEQRQAIINCRAFCVDRPAYRRLKAGLPAGLPLIFDAALNGPGPAEWPSLPTEPQQDAVYIFTSGTTARPRVVRLTHRNLQANTESIVAYLELTPADRMLALLPFDYCFGASLLHTHLRVGGSLVLSRFLYPESMLDVLEATGCTGLAGVPSVYQTLLRNTSFPTRPLKSLAKVQQAGGKLPAVQIKELAAAVPHGQVFVMYGQTEATARLSYLPPALLPTKLGSVGRGIPGVELVVLDSAGAPVAPGAVGEVVARGDNISPGYLDDAAATARKFVAGALHTGDLATVDDEGFITIVDRQDDFIKPLGYRVSSQSIEAHVLELPDVVAAAAIGVPDPAQGEAIYVALTLRAGSTLTPAAVIDHCRRGLARHMVPQRVDIVKSLPLNGNGKVVKSVLREQAALRTAH